jgi:hypothetical protein
MSLISPKSFLKRREIIYLLIIFSPFLISLPVILYYSRISQAPKRGITAGLVFEDNFNNCPQSDLNWQGHPSGGWGCRETGGFSPVPTSGAPSLSPTQFQVEPTPELNGTYSYRVPSEVIDRPRVSFAVLKNKDFDNLSLESMIRVQEIQESALPNHGAGIQARVSVDDLSSETPLVGGYLCFLGKDKLALQRYQLASSSSELRPLNLAVRNFNLETGDWYKLRMEAVGKDLRCVVADAKGSQLMEVSYEDTNSLTKYEKQVGFTQDGPLFTRGTVGFVSYLTPADWDNVRIESLLGPSLTPTPTSLLTPTPTVTPVVKAWLTIKAQFDGFTDLNKGKMSATLKAKGTNLNKVIIFYEDGVADEIPLDNLEPGTYEFILSSFGYLSAKRSLTITAGQNPPAGGYLDFGLLKAGDLNGDDQINGLDWSLLKKQYGESGQE